MTWSTFKFVFLNAHNLALWTIPLGLAILLRVITHRCHHQLVFPLCAYCCCCCRCCPRCPNCYQPDFIVIPVVFYIVVLAGRFDLVRLRADGWVFDMGPVGHEAWYKFYSYLGQFQVYYSIARRDDELMAGLDFRAVQLWPLWSTLPTQFAL